MTLADLAPMLGNVKWQGNNRLMAICPCHDDQNPSLSVELADDGKILVHCFAGCSTNDIVAALGLEMTDLFPDSPSKTSKGSKRSRTLEKEYIYNNGTLKKQRFRNGDGTKTFCWLTQVDGNWVRGRKLEPYLYQRPEELPTVVYLVEGEKDVDALSAAGVAAVSLPDGAKSKWTDLYSRAFAGKTVIILPDNDPAGHAYASMCAGKICHIAESVRVLDLVQAWPEIPEKGDISDMIAEFGAGAALKKVDALIASTPVWTPPPKALNDPLLALFKPLSEFTEEEASWLIPGWIPESQVTLFAADGGIGKTTIWCHLAVALSNGHPCFLDPPGHTRGPIRILFLSGEDSVRKRLRKKLRTAGADMDRVLAPDPADDKNHLLADVKIGSREMEHVLRHFRPQLCILDPIQAFIPPNINMGSRNAMRDCMASLVSLGEELGITFLVVCHTNKRPNASGRARIADSADLWDIARAVIMAGDTGTQDIRYLSHEKSNYGPLQETVLYSVRDEKPFIVGTSGKRDADFVSEAFASKSRVKPQRSDCRDFLIQTLRSAPAQQMKSADLERQAMLHGYSQATIARAKAELREHGIIAFSATGAAKKGDRTWYTQLVTPPDADYPELPRNTPTPFDADSPSAQAK